MGVFIVITAMITVVVSAFLVLYFEDASCEACGRPTPMAYLEASKKVNGKLVGSYKVCGECSAFNFDEIEQMVAEKGGGGSGD